MLTRHILFLSAIGAALLLGHGFVMNFVQAFPTLVKTDNDTVRDGRGQNVSSVGGGRFWPLR